MQIKVRNHTTLTDYAALMRAALYLGGLKEDAEEGGFHFKVTRSEIGTAVSITEKEFERKAGQPRRKMIGEQVYAAVGERKDFEGI